MLRYLITNASFKITFWFRIGSYLKESIKRRRLYYLLYIPYLFVYIIHKHNQYLTGIQLSPDTRIGSGLTFSHYSCIVINSHAIIGDNCTIWNGVTIGSQRGKGVPVIGNNCLIMSGAKVIGNVNVGNNVVIGANAVVIKDVPDNAVVGGIPAKILNYNGTEISKLYFHN
jgi:serine O-acetyltransferase